MESKENYDIFSIAANTIIRWYDQTHTTMTVARKPPSPLNSEFMGILLAAKKHELLIVASISCDINKAIRGFYDWHSDAMQNEYEQLKSRLIKE